MIGKVVLLGGAIPKRGGLHHAVVYERKLGSTSGPSQTLSTSCQCAGLLQSCEQCARRAAEAARIIRSRFVQN